MPKPQPHMGPIGVSREGGSNPIRTDFMLQSE